MASNRPTILSTEDLYSRLTSLESAKLATVLSRTIPDMRRKENPFVDQVYKLAKVAGVIGADYKNAVNRQRDREFQGSRAKVPPQLFEPVKRPWGKRVKKSSVIEHDGKRYLEIKINRHLEHQFRWINSDSPLTTKEVKQLKTFLRPDREDSGTQRTKKKVELRCPMFDSLVELRFDRQVFQMRSQLHLVRLSTAQAVLTDEQLEHMVDAAIYERIVGTTPPEDRYSAHVGTNATRFAQAYAERIAAYQGSRDIVALGTEDPQ